MASLRRHTGSESLICYLGDLVHRISLVAQTVKNLPAVQETQVPSLVQEDSVEKEMATHSSILVWKVHEQRSLEVHGVTKESDITL